MTFEIVPKIFISFILVRELLTTFKDFQDFSGRQTWKSKSLFDYILVRRIKCFLIRFLIIKKHFINNFCSCFNFIIRKIIFLRNVKIEILLSLLSFFKKSLRLKNSFVVVNLKSLANQVISLISGDKRSKENLPIAGCNRY